MSAPAVPSVPATPAAVNAPAVPATPSAPSVPDTKGGGQSAAEDFHEITIDGKVEKLSTAELKRLASLSKGADKRFEESAKMRREAEGLLSRLRDPRQALELLQDPRLGLDRNQVVEAMEDWYTRNVIEPEAMTPEERKYAEAEARLKKYEEKEAAEKARQEKDENDRLDAEEIKKVQQEIIEIIEESGLIKNKFNMGRIAYWVRKNEAMGLKAPKALIIQQVRKEARDNARQFFDKADGDTLIDLVGEENVKRLRKYDIDRIRARRQELMGGDSGQPRQVQADSPKEKIDMRELKRRIREFR